MQLRRFLRNGFMLIGWLTASISIAKQSQTENPFPVIRITIPKSQHTKLQNSKGEKLNLKNVIFSINNDTANVKEIHSRGNNSLLFKRKSLSVDLDKSVKIISDGKKVSLKKFHLLNLVMDRNLWHNRWSFLIMHELGIFPLFNTYCTVYINGQSEGIYLLVEKPHHSTASKKSPYTIRRGVNHSIATEYIDTDSKDEIKKYQKQYKSIYEPGKLLGPELYEHYNKAINLNNYFTWIAFNYLILNGDYADEVFFYINPETKLFEVIPWDYDDIFVPNPHEGIAARNALHKNRMMYSLEDPFDKSIVSDDFVYSKYVMTLIQVLQACDEGLLNRISLKVTEELETLNKDEQNRRVTRYLDKDDFDIDITKDDIEKSMIFVTNRRTTLLNKLR